MPPYLAGLINDLSFISSEPFEVVAQSGKRFFVHSDILDTPGLLQTTGTRKRMDLSNWEDDTVERFAQFLYIGDYKSPDPTPLKDQGEGWEEKIRDLDVENIPDIVEIQTSQEVGGGGGAGVNLLLVHAKVYALAQYTKAERLRKIALDRLRAVLEGIDGNTLAEASKITTNVIELLDYVYCHIDSDADPQTIPEDPVVDLVSTFAANNFEKIIAREKMIVLLRERSNLAVRLMKMVARRLCDPGEVPRGMEKEIQILEHQAPVSDENIRDSRAAKSTLQRPEASYADRLFELETREYWSETRAYWLQKEREVKRKGGQRKFGRPFSFLPNSQSCMDYAQSLKDDVLRLEGQIKLAESACPGKPQEFETLKREKIRKFEAVNATRIREYEVLEIRWLRVSITVSEARLEWFQDVYPEKVPEFNTSFPLSIQELEAYITPKIQQLYKNESPEIHQLHISRELFLKKIEFFEDDLSEVRKAANAAKFQEFKAADAARTRGREIAALARIQWLEAEVEWLENKLKWFKVACPEKVQLWNI